MPEGQHSTNFRSYSSPSYKTAETVFENINQTVLALADAGQILSICLLTGQPLQ